MSWFCVSCEHDFCRTTRSSALAHFWKLSVIFILPLRLAVVVFRIGTPSRDSASWAASLPAALVLTVMAS